MELLRVLESQSLSGWDGVFHDCTGRCSQDRGRGVAIPFRVGWGFSQNEQQLNSVFSIFLSQSLSGWDGVFH